MSRNTAVKRDINRKCSRFLVQFWMKAKLQHFKMLTTCMTFIFLCWNFWRPHFTLTKFELTKKNVQNFAETESTKLTRSRRSNGRCWKWSNSQEHYETISRLSFWLKLLIDLILSTKFLWKGTKIFEDLLFFASELLFASIVKLSLETKQFKRKNVNLLKWIPRY